MDQILSCEEMLDEFTEAYSNKKHVIIMCNNENYSSTTETDELEVYENDGCIIFDNMQGMNYAVKRPSIRWISLSDIFGSKEIKLDLGTSKMNILITE